MHSYTNHLAGETSPYLLQHAHNPVNWYPWGEEALERAKKENKPILVSIGYAACHWCHVMERESFENEATAALMNEHFINIKIDREERPDLDHIYMDAVQAMTGSGGWPLNVFLTPDTKPFYGGTYFPPVRAYNRASWQEVLQGVINAFTQRRHEIDAQAENLTAHLVQSNSFGMQPPTDEEGFFSSDKPDEAFENIMKSADRQWGGFGNAPKFPQTFTIQFLLRYYRVSKDKTALDQALLSLDKMMDGGIYDQLGGGFARYSTDAEWLAPHFEKMLYDNALLIIALSEAYQLTKKNRYRKVIDETMQFVQRELSYTSSSGNNLKGFYAALDADSEGEEGRYYTWSKSEIESILGDDARVFCSYYDVSEKGNWEEKNILRVKREAGEVAASLNIDSNNLDIIIKRSRTRLLEARENRVRPLLDDKIILGWNALMNTACSMAFEATGDEGYRQLAISNMNFLLQHFPATTNGGFYHTWKNEQARYPAFLDDYAFLIQALIRLQEVTGDTEWLLKARNIAEYVIEHFSEEETGYFFYTGKEQFDVIVRKKEVYDGAQPSGNAVMADNLYKLGVLFDNLEWKSRSSTMVSLLGRAITRYPTSFGFWNCGLLGQVEGFVEIAILGKEFESIHRKILGNFIPYRVLMAAQKEEKNFPLLASKSLTDPPSVFICRNFVCLQPVSTIEAVMSLINNASRDN